MDKNSKREISSEIFRLQVLNSRMCALSSDLDNDYFGEREIKSEDLWKITGKAYENAGLKIGMILDMLHETEERLSLLQQSFHEADKEIK